jgi:hypothetical protein
MRLTEDQIKILEKYNINYNFKTIEELFRNIDLIMTDYLDDNDEPTKEYLLLEKLYDEIYNTN